jgi:AcrR family transcriptional regulator
MHRVISHVDVRENILDAVGRLLERYGYRKMTVDDIAREVGIGKGTVYLYFPSKEEMALAWIDRANAGIQEGLRGLAALEGTVAQRLRRMLVARVLARFDSVQDFRQSLDELYADVRPSLLARREKYHSSEATIFAQVLAEGLRNGSLALEDSEVTARLLLIATNSLLPYSLRAAQLGRRDEIEQTTMRLADLLLTGLMRRDDVGGREKEGIGERDDGH